MANPTMFKITSNSKEFMRALNKIPGGLQKVTAATLTDTAQAVTVRGERNIKREMIVRTPFTTKSLRTYKASPGRKIEKQNSVSGTVSPYLPIQDEGGTIRAKKKRIAVPTNRVRGTDRKKKIPARYRIDKMPRAFILKPGKILSRPALFIRRGKKLEKVRDLGGAAYKLKAKKWHTEAVEKYGTWTYMAGVFRRQAKRFLDGVK